MGRTWPLELSTLIFQSWLRYGPHEGLPQLNEALTKKGFLNLVLTLCDATDSVVLFAPYFFNAHMSFSMTGITNILIGPSDPITLDPDTDWLERTLSETKPTPKLVSLRFSDICQRAGSWLVIDNAYEHFMYDGRKHSCIEGNHIINLFSFSKAYGMMGWRVGYIAYPSEATALRTQLLKVQDNVAICAPMISQYLALYCLEAGDEWIKNKVKSLGKNKELLTEALTPLGKDAVTGEGAIYLWARLPEKYSNDDFEVVCWLARRHSVVVLPGSACGVSGCIRVTYGGMPLESCHVAAKRLRKGLEELVTYGMVKEQ
ncbi:hypothetical protein F8388_019313 [Cannabis sativa]|uniref:Aminotransferase class I/classII large domain-containing protein n=1 Tax=Cannabis sativa TaxID=3483 RepID=A0A7J6GZZ2_CANSA|nr:hypothetical protein F8388_019313 [Cannabis sativa]KAF4388331.1 hypothetical protein G4B88_013168 [Cannabis sativa]